MPGILSHRMGSLGCLLPGCQFATLEGAKMLTGLLTALPTRPEASTATPPVGTYSRWLSSAQPKPRQHLSLGT